MTRPPSRQTTKNDIVIEAAQSTGRTQTACRVTIEALLAVLSNYLRMDNTIELRGAFTLLPRHRVAKTGSRNPKTMEPIDVPAHKTVKARFPKGYLNA